MTLALNAFAVGGRRLDCSTDRITETTVVAPTSRPTHEQLVNVELTDEQGREFERRLAQGTPATDEVRAAQAGDRSFLFRAAGR